MLFRKMLLKKDVVFMKELSEKGSVFQILALNDKTKTWLSPFAKTYYKMG